MSAVIKISSPATREFWEIPVLFEDEHVLVLDKPSGLLASPDRQNPQLPSLMKLLHEGIADGKPWSRERGLSYLMNAHRPDADASGIILLAKNKPALIQLANLFGTEKPAKRYLVLARGEPPAASFEADARLAINPERSGQVRVDSRQGKRSHTRFDVLEKYSGYALLNALPRMDRMHQIRVHLRWVGLPAVGDALYGSKPLWLSRLKPNYRLKEGREERPLLARAALHAEHLAMPHPITGEPLAVTAPWPKDFKVAIKYLRQYAGNAECPPPAA